jgi:hypothetical protein
VAFAKRQKVNGVQYIGFSHAVITDKAIDLWRKHQLCFGNVLIVKY